MQSGSITRSTRSHGPDVWEFRWREAGADGKRKHRRMVIGSIVQFSDKASALLEVAALRREINLNDPRLSLQPVTVSELVNHYRQRELATDHTWKTHSTKVTYQGYLNKWILPRWGNYTLSAINAGEVELWLRSLPLARATCAKIRNLMSVVFNHGIRHQVYSRNPIRLVRQSAKRRRIPVVLSVSEVQQLLDALALRERTLVLLDVGTGLRMSELFGLKWKDVDFDANEISVVRSIVMQVTGPCKKGIVAETRSARSLSGRSTAGMASTSKIQWTGGLGLCQPQRERSATILGTTNHAQSHSAYRDSSGDHQRYRVAHLPPYVFDNAAGNQSGHQGHAGTA